VSYGVTCRAETAKGCFAGSAADILRKYGSEYRETQRKPLPALTSKQVKLLPSDKTAWEGVPPLFVKSALRI
jgi:hypothetical protein